MAALTTIALAGGLLLGGVGAYVQYQGQQAAAAAQEKSTAAQQRAEAARQRQMELEASRRKREIIRQGVLQRAQTTAAAVASGAQFGSGLPGALGGATGQQNYNVQGVEHSQAVGQEIFGANQQLLGARREEAQAGATTALGGGLSSFGSRLVSNLGSINRLATQFGV